MRRLGLAAPRFVRFLLGIAAVGATVAPGFARAEILTADRAVQLALRQNAQVIGAEAGVLEARSGLYGAYAGGLPSVRGSLSRFNSETKGQEASGVEFIGGQPFNYSVTSDYEAHGTTPSVSGTWSILNLSSLTGVSAARNGMKAARFTRQA